MRLNPETRWLDHEGRRVRVSPTHVRILEILHDRKGVVPYSVFFDLALAGGAEDEKGSLRVHLTHLRRALDGAGIPRLVGVAWGAGLHLLHPVELVRAQRDVVVPGDKALRLARALEGLPSSREVDELIIMLTCHK